MSATSACRWTSRALLAAGAVAAALVLGAPSVSEAQPLPRPFEFVSNLDLKCYRVEGPSIQPAKLQLTHLNPVLIKMGLPVETVALGGLKQLCVPVAKDNLLPPPAVQAFIEYVDLACYAITAFTPPTKAALTLHHLNRVLVGLGLPREQVVITQPQQLCVPVAKNDKIPPPEVRRLVQYIDLKCYEMIPDSDIAPVGLRLAHLNPVLRELGMPDEEVRMHSPKQLCVPVYKNQAVPPTDVANVIRWIDLKKYVIDAPPVTPVTLALRHLNPVFANQPAIKVTLVAAEQLGVPVMKNGLQPPQ